MIEQDTIRLLRECDAGIKMGVSAIDEVLSHVNDLRFRLILTQCRSKHESLSHKAQCLLECYQDEGKDPPPLAKGMSWLKTNWKMAMDGSDASIADLITDGCNLAVKGLTRYLHQYKAADEASKKIALELILLEDQLVQDIRPYL